VKISVHCFESKIVRFLVLAEFTIMIRNTYRQL